MAVSLVSTRDPADARRAVDLLGGMEEFVGKGEKVLVKPNICAGKDSDTGAVTDPRLVAEVCRMVDECGGEPLVGESPIYPYHGSRVFKQAGYGDFEKEYGYPIYDLDKEENVRVAIPRGEAIGHTILPRLVLDCEKLINIPVLKTHLQTMVSLGLKNLKGLVPGRQKHMIHMAGLDRGIVDLNTLIYSNLTIVDGIMGMEGGQGPTHGKPIRLDVIVAGDNVVETDGFTARLMGADPHAIKHLQMAEEEGLGNLDGFEVKGEEPEGLARKLELPRRPGLNRMMISGILVRGYSLALNLVGLLTGRERVERRPRVGELVIDHDKCDGCRLCISACPVEALSYDDGLSCDREDCILCFCCAEVCPQGALTKRE